MAYATLDAHLPMDVVDTIAATVHKHHMDGVLPSIRSTMRSMIADATAVKMVDRLRAEYPGLKVHKENELEWFTAILMLNERQVMIYHAYFDNPMYTEAFLCEAMLNEDTLSIGCSAAAFKHKQIVDDDYLTRNTLPIAFLNEVLGREVTVRTRKTVSPPVVGDWDVLHDVFSEM